jgi:tRNA(Ile)-lysidine synthase
MNSTYSHDLTKSFSGLSRIRRKYILKFINHVHGFMQTHRLRPKQDRYLLAVSGGVDSMAMLSAFWLMRERQLIKDLRVIFIHHNTRHGQNQEESLVHDFCHANTIPFLSRRLIGLSVDQSNFEMKARELRHQEMLSEVSDDEYLVMAHHIDDSFEWSLLQQLRSSNLESSIGIPTKRGKIIRPFMCVTRLHIERFNHYLNTPCVSDPTNQDIHFERNYLRHQVIGPMRERHPQYLKHYVERSNQIAMSRGQHLLSRKNAGGVRVVADTAKNISLVFDTTFNNQFQHSLEVIKNCVHELSQSKRGTLQLQLQKIIAATQSGAIGPLSLSGEIEVYLEHSLILILSKIAKNHFEFLDAKFAQKLLKNKLVFEKYTLAEFKHQFEQSLQEEGAQFYFPFWVVVRVPHKFEKYLRTKKLKHPLWPKSHAVFSQDQQFQVVSATKLIHLWQKDRLLAQTQLELNSMWCE